MHKNYKLEQECFELFLTANIIFLEVFYNIKESNKKVPSIQGWKATLFPEASLQNIVSSNNHMLLCFQSFHTLNLEKYKNECRRTS